ncbi:helix-turn-helix transcriptional regulator [Priestia megaterium]|jgi:transcriptional regulator with XRE-family HTH domain|uniref:helix-turn-helix domain-containing protein n=1 Tax=Priestia megaterium TaxID=1404 RepID=UPI0021C06CDF|nr:helix-turn-helix transcriptional regulator [Priestia megaterium]MCT9852884.1 helix-turn-helix transcriptional regulator [Priestia megaterium]MDF1962456.1 helix-turn-helix transcriptional regulator [Priestia megaterium]
MFNFAERLRALRKEKNMSQKELGKILGLAESTVGMYEQGKRQPDFETLKKISDFFSVTIDYLVTGNTIAKSSDDMWKEFLDPRTELFFKDLKSAPEEKIEELIRFWEFINERDK